MARDLGISDALGHTLDGKLALWQVIARVIDQGSRLSAVRFATNHAACEILGLGAFNEDDLYANLDWLAEKQSAIEDRLFRRRANTRFAPTTAPFWCSKDDQLGPWGLAHCGLTPDA